jgi:hypothetical protein
MNNLTDITGSVSPVNIQELEDAPFCITYVLPGAVGAGGDYGNGFTEVIESPPGFRGKVRAISLYNVTEAFTAVTTPAYCYVGISGDTDAFCLSAGLGTTAIGAADSPALTDGATHIIQPGTTIHVTGVAPTGGTPAGVCDTAVTIQYFK